MKIHRESHQPIFIIKDKPDSRTSAYVKKVRDNNADKFDKMTGRDK